MPQASSAPAPSAKRIRAVPFGLAALLGCGGNPQPLVLPGNADNCGIVAEPVAPLVRDARSTLRTRRGPGLDYIGTALDAALLETDSAYAALAACEFDAVTPENAMKWGEIERVEGIRDYTAADRIVEFAEAHGMRVRGHALLWHRQLPAFVAAGTMDAATLTSAIEAHIADLVGRYRGRIYAWDVVNEALGDYGGGYRRSVFHDTLGPAFIAAAFRAARAADPDAKLYYNDFYVEGATTKADDLYSLVAGLVADGVPIDGVGLQSHVITGLYVPTSAQLRANIERLEALGLDVAITELDVQIAPGLALQCPTKDDALAWQAVIYRDFARTCYEEPACVGLTIWGFTDRASWIDVEFQPDDPLLLDDADVRKPSYYGVLLGIDGSD